MFDHMKYRTKGVQSNIPDYLQNLMWYLIETMDVQSKDYLQVFHLRVVMDEGKRIQQIVHTQEESEYQKEYIIRARQPIDAKVFVIDDGPHCTMLLAEEY